MGKTAAQKEPYWKQMEEFGARWGATDWKDKKKECGHGTNGSVTAFL